MIIDKERILCLAGRLVLEDYKGSLGKPENFLRHTELTYEIAGETTDRILKHYPSFRSMFSKELIEAAGGLHDIGRPLRRDQRFHGIRGAKYIKDNWKEIGIADSEHIVDVIVQMFLPHGLAYEEFTEPKNVGMRKEFGSVDTSYLLPNTWQEAIIVYADGKNDGRNVISIEERFESAMKKYLANREHLGFYKMLKTGGMERMYKVCKSVMDFSEGKLDEEQIRHSGLSFKPRKLGIKF